MLCPHCQKPLLIVEYQGVELDGCVDGGGIWFDAQELTQLFELAGVPCELHDLEDRLEDLEDGATRRRCPRCRGEMQPVHAPGSPDTLILDRCEREHGLFFDRGELMALLTCLLPPDDEALDRVRDFLGAFAGTGDLSGQESS